MRVKFICHSGFYIEGEKNCLLFDYWKGALPKIPADKRLWIFASHHHPDHYDPEIFRIGEQHPESYYFLGCDITLNAANREKMGITDAAFDRCRRMHKDDVLKMDGVTVRALRSTDMGVAFCVECEGKRIYHGGDHNLWHWHEDASFDRSQTHRFYEEIEKLRSLPIDAAFLPLDPRLGDEYWRGFDAFTRLLEPKRIFPMHMVDDYGIVGRMKENPIAWPYKNRIVPVSAEGEEFEI